MDSCSTPTSSISKGQFDTTHHEASLNHQLMPWPLPSWLQRRSRRRSSNSSSMGARIAQLRTAFGLDEGEELYGQFSCAHTRPRWGAQFLQVRRRWFRRQQCLCCNC